MVHGVTAPCVTAPPQHNTHTFSKGQHSILSRCQHNISQPYRWHAHSTEQCHTKCSRYRSTGTQHPCTMLCCWDLGALLWLLWASGSTHPSPLRNPHQQVCETPRQNHAVRMSNHIYAAPAPSLCMILYHIARKGSARAQKAPT